jgi:hypothetical protein
MILQAVPRLLQPASRLMPFMRPPLLLLPLLLFFASSS